MGNYSEFGLDETKKSVDNGENEQWFYDPFMKDRVESGRYFYLCFSNWVLSKQAADRMIGRKPEAPRMVGEKCFKCNMKVETLHYYDLEYDSLGVCTKCLEIAVKYYAAKVPIGTQFKLF